MSQEKITPFVPDLHLISSYVIMLAFSSYGWYVSSHGRKRGELWQHQV